MTDQKRLKDQFNESVIHNFEVSLVMPFYKKLREFKKVLPLNARILQRNGIEVLVVMDEPSEEAGLLELIFKYPFINWKVIVNDKIHNPRNPSKVLNVGIRNATKKYVMVSSPETLMYTDVIFQLRSILEYYPEHYAIGTVAFIQEDANVTNETVKTYWFLPYGSFMARKEYLERVTGYDESFEEWGGDDDNIRKRLDMIGISKLLVPESKSLHLEKELRLADRTKISRSFAPAQMRKINYPDIAEANGQDWGSDFNRISYDWQNNNYSGKLCLNYLNQFVKYKIWDNQIFKKKYLKLILCQSYNNTEYLKDFLENMGTYFDGIILLDDSSSDGTYELALHEKLLLKVSKKREGFNDLQNRNILLNLASFFSSEWFCFMDLDERFDERFVDFESITNTANIYTVVFRYIHLWNEDQFYNASYPYSCDGICSKTRMFRNIGSSRINTQLKKIHIDASPVKQSLFNSNVLVKHLGNLTKENRAKRYELYKIEDTFHDQKSYDHLLVENPALKRVDEITLDLLVKNS
ncbi:MAG: glycosyltransferase family 2 protein [Bacteroidales bacterium]|nr:glycosyltransferase family 2 protein [Bacteroidales bacterium]